MQLISIFAKGICLTEPLKVLKEFEDRVKFGIEFHSLGAYT